MSKTADKSIHNENPGPFIVTDVLDLHGFFPEQIEEIVTDFIRNALDLNIHYVRIIHGKGKSRLKYEVHRTLKANRRVDQYKDAPPFLGGWGATVVELDVDE